MTDPDQRLLDQWAAMKRANAERYSRQPLSGDGGGGISGGMEARVAKLEALMEGVRSDIAKLSDAPADIAVIKERMSHVPTRADAKSDIDAAVDRAGARTQRTVAVVGALVAIAVAGMNYLPRLLAH